MALDMSLELEDIPNALDDCRKAAEKTGVIWPKDDLGTDFLHGNFRHSNLYFWRSRGATNSGAVPHAICAEGLHDCEFIVKHVVTFRLVNANYDECVHDIKEFLTNLTQISSIQFILSFQGERVYSLRDKKRGFEWFWNQPR
jgi:hypothetical protein